MAFLFKSKKHHQERAMQSREGGGPHPPAQGPVNRVPRDERSLASRSTPSGSVGSFDNEAHGSPNQDAEKLALRRAALEQQQAQAQQAQQQLQQQSSDLPFRNGAQPPNAPLQNPNASLYPWSQRRVIFTSSIPSPFPRYGAAVNSVSSKEGDVYVMGGLINSSTVKGDLWMIEAGGSMTCYPLATTAEGPGPRVGHASLLVGNAFIVYGGDTKIDEMDILDETLYLLNTSTRQWSRALPAGPRPSGRYGHSLNIIGSKIYIFGGQVEGYFMNDLAAFDLNQLQAPNNRWEVLMENTEGLATPVQGKCPPARTNHSMITYNDKLYLFGGTNGFSWFNDVWCYDPAINRWAQLDCIGYIPVPREGHAASLVDDVMYIFGGRTEEGADLGDLAAFRIASRRWYTFQNMGPSPSPRSGHSMTTVGKSIVVVGGEPSTPTSTANDLSLVYVLDTAKIRYPNDSQIQPTQSTPTPKVPHGRRPSAGDVQSARLPPSRDAPQGPTEHRRVREASGPGSPTSSKPAAAMAQNLPPSAFSNSSSRLPRAPGATTPPGPPPPGQAPRPVGTPTSTVSNGRIRNASMERIEREAARQASPLQNAGQNSVQTPVHNYVQNVVQTPMQSSQAQSSIPISRAVIPEQSPVSNGSRTPVQPATRSGSKSESMDATAQPLRPASPPPPTRQNSNSVSRRGSARSSQTVTILKELDASRNRVAWLTSELELAHKAGYVTNAAMSPVLGGRSVSTFDDEDKPLIEGLLAMRQELAKVQMQVDKQAVLAAKQVAEAERQRDAAIHEALYAKAKIAAFGGSSANTSQTDSARDGESDRGAEMSRKLAAVLKRTQTVESELARTTSELETEKRARQLADETASATQKRMADLEQYKQHTSAEVEALKADLHSAQREAREQSTAGAEAIAAMQALRLEKDELVAKYNEATGNDGRGIDLDALQAAVVASEDVRTHLESKLEEERSRREAVEAKMTQLKAEHDAHTAELATVSQRLRDAQEVAEKHAIEARTHRVALLSGLDKLSIDKSKSNEGDAERVAALQAQIDTANNLVTKFKAEADVISDKLRSAEERIAGLEAYQEQSSREGVTIRRQLQAALKDTQSLQALNSDLKNQLASQQLERNAITVQHNTLKDILSERNISPSGLVRVRGMSSRTDSPSADLEQQLAEAKAAAADMKQNLESQAQQTEATYRDRVSQLESDYQSAVHYVKGTEKMLKRMKEELSKYKTENTRLKSENMDLEDRTNSSTSRDVSTPAPADWEKERSGLLAKIEALQEQVQATSAQLESQLADVRKELELTQQTLDRTRKSSDEMAQTLGSKEKDLEQMLEDNALLEKRAQDAEHKVGLLLDQVSGVAEGYRRRSRQTGSTTGETSASNTDSNAGANGLGHTRQESSEVESIYGGVGERNSAALENLADELDMLRSKWEATNENYRLSNAFDFDTATACKKGDDGAGLGLSASLADWRKRLDHEEQDLQHSGPSNGRGSGGQGAKPV